MDLKLTSGQSQALEVIKNLPKKFPGGGGLAIISGAAGTGKSTAIRILAQETPGLFILTPTGKAAVRVKEIADCDAMTIHKWLYVPRKNEKTGDTEWDTKRSDELRLPPNNTLIIDEASMITHKIFEHLRFFTKALGLNMVLIGDSFQLAPVEVDPDKRNFSVFTADLQADRVELTEILRQALENPIIRIGAEIRKSTDIGSILMQLDFVSEKELDSALKGTWDSKGVIICHQNKTRHQINNKVRELRSLNVNSLQSNEPLLVIKNNYELGVFNGETFTIDSLLDKHGPTAVIDRYKNKSMNLNLQEVKFFDNPNVALVSPEEIFGKTGDISMDAIKRDARYYIKKTFEFKEIKPPEYLHANLGYAISGHKSQGSEWSNVLVLFEPSIKLNTVEGRRWAYTALTRTKDKVKIHFL